MVRSALHDAHVGLGARFIDFAEWEMPVHYVGVLAEHKAVRSSVGIFDVSHLGRFTVEGPGSTDLLRALLCNDVARIQPGRAQYTMSLNPAGGVEDDIIVWRWDEESYWVIPNGANNDKILAHFRTAAPAGTEIRSVKESTALIAVQGPDAPAAVEQVLGLFPGRFRLARADFAGHPVWTAGTGYTGEKGGEIAAPHAVATTLFQAFLEAGATPAGLGCRDTLRLEMGYPLWGQDLDPATTPLEAGLDWVVDWDHDFVGRESLVRQRREGPPKRLTGFTIDGREIARHGYPLRAGASRGVVTSGNFSPTLEQGIGMGYLAPPAAHEAPIEVEVRGRWIPAQHRIPPFIEGK